MTTYTTPDSLPIIEPTVDLIKDGAEVSALAGDISALATATQAALAARASTAASDATTKADAAQTAAIDDATTKYGGLPGRVAAVEAKQAVKCVRLEAGKWVWDLAGATHYLLPDHTGVLVARPTPWPVPNAATPTLDW